MNVKLHVLLHCRDFENEVGHRGKVLLQVTFCFFLLFVQQSNNH